MMTHADSRRHDGPAHGGAVGRWKRRIFGAARLTAYVFCANLAVAAVGARVVWANLGDGSLRMGRELAAMGDAFGATKTVFFNGAEMNVSTALTAATPGEVLDRFEALCREHPQVLARAIDDIPEALRGEALRRDDGVRFGVVRAEARGDGALTCFMDDRRTSIRDLPERLKAFSRSGDLSEFGRFRYVYAQRLENGQTRVRTAWTDGPLNVKEMFPATGDAAGFDSPVVPRPAGSRRILAATARQVPFGVHVYDAPQDAESLARFYDDRMKSQGWTRAGDEGRRDVAAYRSDEGHGAYVSFATRREHTIVTIVETAGVAGPREAAAREANAKELP
jgi:hypothetical protein